MLTEENKQKLLLEINEFIEDYPEGKLIKEELFKAIVELRNNDWSVFTPCEDCDNPSCKDNYKIWYCRERQ